MISNLDRSQLRSAAGVLHRQGINSRQELVDRFDKHGARVYEGIRGIGPVRNRLLRHAIATLDRDAWESTTLLPWTIPDSPLYSGENNEEAPK